jgi:hypothetical protein
VGIRGERISRKDIRGERISRKDIKGARISRKDIRGKRISRKDIRGERSFKEGYQGGARMLKEDERISREYERGKRILKEDIRVRGFQGRISWVKGFQGANQGDIPEMLPLATAAENSSDIQMWNWNSGSLCNPPHQTWMCIKGLSKDWWRF